MRSDRGRFVRLLRRRVGRGTHRAVEAHLSDCAACRSQLDKMAKLSNALHANGYLGAPKRPLVEELLRELDKEDRKQENNTSSD